MKWTGDLLGTREGSGGVATAKGDLKEVPSELGKEAKGGPDRQRKEVEAEQAKHSFWGATVALLVEMFEANGAPTTPGSAAAPAKKLKQQQRSSSSSSGPKTSKDEATEGEDSEEDAPPPLCEDSEEDALPPLLDPATSADEADEAEVSSEEEPDAELEVWREKKHAVQEVLHSTQAYAKQWLLAKKNDDLLAMKLIESKVEEALAKSLDEQLLLQEEDQSEKKAEKQVEEKQLPKQKDHRKKGSPR